ncbi:MAG TPA: AMP-binding protein, partial [Burkholderiales bacterium]|nr:AMP-binding protein [Burkholderiales bacterium]
LSGFLGELERFAATVTAPALMSETGAWSYRALHDATRVAADELRRREVRVLASMCDNSAQWVVADLAALRAGVTHVPLPTFFTPEQQRFALDSAGVDAVLAAASLLPTLTAWGFEPAGRAWQGDAGLALVQRRTRGTAPPAGTAKITFTSGTTGAPKGVCLGADSMLAVAHGLVHATRGLGIDRHLCALPLAVLLENVAGVLAPLLRGATCIVVPTRAVGLQGSSRFDPGVFNGAVERYRPHSLILLPQMLRAWTGWLLANRVPPPASLQIVAVGGAAVGARTLADARTIGIPAYEGYGLSEGASVQTLNLPGADRPGSAGRPLPHCRVRIAADGEIEVGGNLSRGYLGDPRPVPAWWPTGDLGELDADGFLHVRGRKTNVLVTAFGRNVSPEWVETALRSEPAVAQAVVFGHSRPALSAVIWPSASVVPDAALDAAVAAAHAHLPDYARVQTWVRGALPFDAEHGMSTANGRPRRQAIEARHRGALFPDRTALA